jgi:hypothetical protein
MAETLTEAFGFKVGQRVRMLVETMGCDHESEEHTVPAGAIATIDSIDRYDNNQGINFTVVIPVPGKDDEYNIVNCFDELDGLPSKFFEPAEGSVIKSYVSPTGSPIVGTLERLQGIAAINGIKGNGEPEYAGETEVLWDGQVPERRDGQLIYLDEQGLEWAFGQLVEKEMFARGIAAAIPKLLQLREWIERYDGKMDGDDLGHGSRPPDGDDYNALHAEVIGTLKEILG